MRLIRDFEEAASLGPRSIIHAALRTAPRGCQLGRRRDPHRPVDGAATGRPVWLAWEQSHLEIGQGTPRRHRGGPAGLGSGRPWRGHVTRRGGHAHTPQARSGPARGPGLDLRCPIPPEEQCRRWIYRACVRPTDGGMKKAKPRLRRGEKKGCAVFRYF